MFLTSLGWVRLWIPRLWWFWTLREYRGDLMFVSTAPWPLINRQGDNIWYTPFEIFWWLKFATFIKFWLKFHGPVRSSGGVILTFKGLAKLASWAHPAQQRGSPVSPPLRRYMARSAVSHSNRGNPADQKRGFRSPHGKVWQDTLWLVGHIV